MPKVSVLIAAYGVEPYIERAICSVQAQNLADLELVIVDDASPDGTAAVVTRMAENDPRVRLVRHQRNAGPSAARNTAIEAARGEWLAILDGDDWIAPQRLERLVDEAERCRADLVADDVLLVWDGEETPFGHVVKDRSEAVGFVDPAAFIDADQPGMDGFGILQPMIRRSFLDRHAIRYREGLDRIEDFLLFVDCFAAGGRLLLLNEGMYFYRQRRGSHRVASMSIVAALELALHGNDLARERLSPTADEAVMQALDRRGAAIERTLRYRRIAEPLRQGELGAGLRQLALDPVVARDLVVQGARIAGRRLSTMWKSVGLAVPLPVWW